MEVSSAEVLDLCVRKRPQTPQTEAYPIRDHPTMFDPAICQYSPMSNSDSECSEVSSNSEMKAFNLKSKACRPFKAYIKDPFTLAQGVVSADLLLSANSSEAFTQFRSKILSQVSSTNSGTNKNMRRTSANHIPGKKVEDPTYWEKRKKNNEAAKRSRDARRAKEDEIAIRCAFLEQENCHLKFVTESLKRELERLQQIIYMKELRN